jgi:hypothetical protein
VNARRRAEDTAMESDCDADCVVVAGDDEVVVVVASSPSPLPPRLPSSLATKLILVLNKGSLYNLLIAY